MGVNMNFLKPYLGRLVCTALGLVAAILFMTLGFFKTLLILLCCGVGYTAGLFKDKGFRLPEQLMFWRNNRW